MFDWRTEPLAYVMERLRRHNSKLIVDELLPVGITVSGHQMSLPLIHQAEIPDDK
jgi:hypothetical protein